MSDPIWTVSDLAEAVRASLSTAFPVPLWVTGEVSNFSRAPSGHFYFTLRDDHAAIACTLWRSRADRMMRGEGGGLPKNGDAIEVFGQLTTYAPRGTYQLDVQQIRAAGAGAWFQRFLAVKAKLEAEGLFDAARKRPLPRFPRRIAIVTSPQADALQDVLRTLAGRAPMITAVLVPTLVQGPQAPDAIVAALTTVAQCAAALRLEAVLLVRGGGAAEDLAAFNEERVARAIAACPIPVVSGVGHETDTTIADFVADARAPTPTGAAVLIAQGWSEVVSQVQELDARLKRAFRIQWQQVNQQLDWGERDLKRLSPAFAIRERRERLEQRYAALREALAQRLRSAARTLEATAARLCHPRAQLAAQRTALEAIAQRLPHPLALLAPYRRAWSASSDRLRAASFDLAEPKRRLETLAARLEALSPTAVLARGYALVFDSESGRLITRAAQLETEERIAILFADGRARANVVATEETK